MYCVNADCPWCLLCRSCCRSVRATEIASCLSTTCCLGRTPALALPNTSMWTTSVNQVSSAAQLSFVRDLFLSLHPLPVNFGISFSGGWAWNSYTSRHKTISPLPPVLTPQFPPAIIPFPSSSFLFFSPHSAEHKRHVVCEGETMILRCKPPRVLNIYAAVYGRSLGQTNTCPSHLTRPPPFGESPYSVFSCGDN